LLTVEEGGVNMGWGAEVSARVAENDNLNVKIKRLGAGNFPIANAKSLEDKILPSKSMIKQTLRELSEN